MPPYTFNKKADGLFETFQNGQRISTGTADNARAQYGYTGAVTQPQSVDVTQLGGPSVSSQNLARPPQQDMSGYNAMINSFAGPTQEERAYESGVGQLFGLQNKLKSRGTETQIEEQNAGIPQKTQDVQDLENRFNAIRAETNAIPLQLMQDATGRGMTVGGLQPIQTAALRNNAIQALTVGSQLQAAQGNLQTAQQLVDRKIQLKYQPIIDEIEATKQNLSLIQPLMNAAESRRAKQLENSLREREKQIEADKASEKEISTLALEARRNGASDQIVNKILNAPTYFDAINAAGLGVFDVTKTLQNDLLREQILTQRNNRLVDAAKAGSPSAMKALGISNIDGGASPEILSYAELYASTGKIPAGIPKGSFGTIAAVAKVLPKPDGTIVDSRTNTKPDISDVKIDGYAALYDILKKSEDLKMLNQQREKGLQGLKGTYAGDPIQTQYQTLRSEIIDLLARARTGAALTIPEQKFYGEQLPYSFSEPFGYGVKGDVLIDGFTSKIKETLKTKSAAQGISIVGFTEVDVGGTKYKVGEIIESNNGRNFRVLPDGNLIEI